jgi:hypothetical protein
MFARLPLVAIVSVLSSVTDLPGGPGRISEAATPPEPTVVLPSCDPRILHSPQPGTIDAVGSGVAEVQRIEASDLAGNPLPDSAASVEWSARAIVSDAPGGARISHDIGGYLNLDISTESGRRIRFRAHCIAGAGAIRDSEFGITGGITLYANGTTTGWPVGSESNGEPKTGRRSFVHFEAVAFDDGQTLIYFAIVDGEDCALNFESLIWTPDAFFVPGEGSGPGSITGSLPPDGTRRYSETNCGLVDGPGKAVKGPPGVVGAP